MALTENDASDNNTDDFSTSSKSTYVTTTKRPTLKSKKSKWKILAHAITKNRKTETSRISKKGYGRKQDQNVSQILRFPSYNLIHYKVLSKAHLPSRVGTSNTCEPASVSDKADEERRTWYQICAQGYSEVNLKISCINPKFTIQEINGFNNTGNVCIWPAEECLSIFCLENPQLFNEKSVIELGAGMTGLAGLIVAQSCNSEKVTLTDGNEASVRNLTALVKENNFNAEVQCQVLKWNDMIEDERMPIQFDIAICADCLFFDAGRPQLIKCLAKILKPKGMAVIVAPRRSGTLDNFINLINNQTSTFSPVKINYQYSEQIWSRRQELINSHSAEFEEDIDYPVMLMCERK